MENVVAPINGRGIQMLCSMKGENIKGHAIQVTPRGIPAIYSQKCSEVHSAYRYLQKVDEKKEYTEYTFLLDRKLATAFALPEGERRVPYMHECPNGCKIAMELNRVRQGDNYHYIVCFDKKMADRYDLQMITLL